MRETQSCWCSLPRIHRSIPGDLESNRQRPAMEHHCCSHSSSSSVTQTLDELSFERGVWSAAMDGELSRVGQYLNTGGDPNAVDSSGYTALVNIYYQHYAARSGHKDICQLLLDNRANPNAQTKSGGATPLHRAAYQGHTEVVRLLLGRGGDVCLLDSDGKSPLHKAAERGRTEVCRLLAERDSSLLNIRDSRGKLPVDCVQETQEQLRIMLQPT